MNLSKRSSTTNDHDSSEKTKAIELKHALHSVKSQIPLNHCLWLLITIFLQILLLFFFISSSPPSNTQQLVTLNPECQSGYFYVYNLPSTFNKEYIDKCYNLDPWKSTRCNAVSNKGFGPKATGLDHIIPKNLTPAWYWTDMYAAEVIYHNRMLSHKCRTSNPDKATGFYIPFYAGLDVGRFLWFNYTAKERDLKSKMVLDWLKEQPTFTRLKGVDHFIMLGRLTWDFRRLSDNDSEWGSSLLYMPLMKNIFHLSVEKHLNDDIEESVPYPTAFHPSSESDIVLWQDYIRNYKRTKLFSFVGAKREKIKNDFRGILMDYCISEETCRAVDCAATTTNDCAEGAPVIVETFLDSDFCLQPRGDGVTRRSMFDCMLAGSIPVYFWKGTFKGQYEWHLPWMAESYTVFIDNVDVRNTNGSVIRKVLESIHKDKVKEMRETLINLLPKLVYARSGEDLGSVKDAFDVTIERVLKRLKTRKDQFLSEPGDF